MIKKIDAIIFDLGGVLIDWNPKYVYDKVFEGDTKKSDWFLNNICTSAWNVQQDAGRLMSVATEELIAQHPQYEDLIRLFYDRWPDMLKGDIPETVEVLKALKASNSYRIFALTNWSDESFYIAKERFEFLQLFEGILVSGTEKMMKPNRDIYELCLTRFNIIPQQTVFIDDNLQNILGAQAVGLQTIHFKDAGQLRIELHQLGLNF